MNSLTRWFLFRAFHDTAVKVSARAAVSSEGLVGAGGSASKTAPSHGYCQGPQFLTMWATL